MADGTQPIAWSALEEGTSVHSRDDIELGKVSAVVGDLEKDIFSGIAYRSGLLDRQVFVPADRIQTLTAERVTLALSETEAQQLEPYED